MRTLDAYLEITLSRKHFEKIDNDRQVILIDKNPLPDPDDRDAPGSGTAIQHLRSEAHSCGGFRDRQALHRRPPRKRFVTDSFQAFTATL